MDIIKTYFLNVNKDIQNEILVDNYKIITVNNKSTETFLIYDKQFNKLNSQTLMKLLMLKSGQDILGKLLGDTKKEGKVYINRITDISQSLYEDRIFFNFDPYGNFLLSNKSNRKEIRDIIKKTTSYYNSNSLHSKQSNTRNFCNMINPYGLEKIVLTGGGTKGIIYIGALIGLLATGQLFYLNHFSGSSVGALTAMVFSCITPSLGEYNILKKMTLRNILMTKTEIVEKYQIAVNFIVKNFYERTVDTFYKSPVYTFYGVWTALDKIIKNNGLYDPKKSGFQVWYAIVCKKVCHIMGNGLDKLINIKKKDGTYVEFNDNKNLNKPCMDINN